MSGHGWVTPNLDGSKARCGGPGLCSECSREALTEGAATPLRDQLGTTAVNTEPGMITMRGKPIRTTPYVGQMVHYRSYGTLGGEHTPASRAAVVTEVQADPRNSVGLCVLNPGGQFFNPAIPMDPGIYKWRVVTVGGPIEPLPLVTCDDLEFAAGSWHFIAEAP